MRWIKIVIGMPFVLVMAAIAYPLALVFVFFDSCITEAIAEFDRRVQRKTHEQEAKEGIRLHAPLPDHGSLGRDD